MNTFLANLLLVFSIISFITGIGMVAYFVLRTGFVVKEPHELLLAEFGNRLAKMKKDYRKKYGK